MGVLSAKEIAEKNGLDIVSAEILRMQLIGASRQMFNNLMRSSFSTAVRDYMDATTAVHMVTEEGSELCAVTEGCCQQAFVVHTNCNLVMEEFGPENLHPGDVVVCNDGYRGAIHQGDINLYRGVFIDGELVFYLHDCAHLADLGGMNPGAFWLAATDYYQEGLVVPPTLIYSMDVPVRSTFNLICERTRTAFLNLGDIRALYGTLRVADRRIHELATTYGVEKLRAGARYAIEYSENAMRKALSELPDGTWEADDYMDDDAVERDTVKLKVTVRKWGDSLELDYSGSQRQTLGAVNTCWVDNYRWIVGMKLFIEPETPVNAGTLRPFHVVNPPGTVMCPLPPASYSDHMELAGRLPWLAGSALAKGAPHIALGQDISAPNLAYFAGVDTRPGHPYMPYGLFIVSVHSWGGTPTNDGIQFCLTPNFANVHQSVYEHLEKETPLRVWEWKLAVDTAGAGKYRGGSAGILTVEALVDGVYLAVMAEHGKFPPQGAAGGGRSGTAYVWKLKKDERGGAWSENGVVPASRIIPLGGLYDEQGRPDPINGKMENSLNKTVKIALMVLKAGEVITIYGCGGGGWGDPLEREMELVEREIKNGIVSVEAAEEYYGVIINPKTLKADGDKTLRKRAELGKKRDRGEWSVPIMRHPKWPL